MKRLVLMRHAKAEHFHPDGDHARHLTGRGRSAAAAAGLVLRDLDLTMALVSTAVRTRETFAALELDIVPEYADWLYLGSVSTLRAHLGELDDDVSSVIVIGHAPTIPGLATDLAQAAESTPLTTDFTWFPTAGFAEFTFDGAWEDLATKKIPVRIPRVQL